MGCVSSKQARSRSPAYPSSSVRATHRERENGSTLSDSTSSSSQPYNGGFAPLEKITEEPEKENEEGLKRRHSGALKVSKKGGGSGKRAVFSIKFGRLTEGEHAAAGWPTWLTAVAGEAIEGWLPLRSDSFQRLEKIGQGTYSSVYRARHVETGKMRALKKVRFDNFQPESVRFMAREIAILRRLDHPNIMKLEGIITSRLSCSVYLVFEYMEHDLSGLLSCPDIKFSESQIKCYMHQLLSGLEHCHSRGIMHRDIKTSNILVNNEGILKIADFGLANVIHAKQKQPLTSRVVTLWYRPPELLLGSTSYGSTVDMWSVGCVFAELFFGRPLLKGRTEVEQLHKIFKLCGSPPDEYWKRSKLPLATMFRPQQPYESTLRERCKELPKTAVKLLEIFLSVEPSMRGTTSSALASEYFNTKPCACSPSSLPKYPPNKEIDAKFREDARRKKGGVTVGSSGASRNPRRVRKGLQAQSSFYKVVPTEDVEANSHVARQTYASSAYLSKGRGVLEPRTSQRQSYDTVSEASQTTVESHGDSIKSVPVQITGASGFAWAKRTKKDLSSQRYHGHAASRSQKFDELDPSSKLHRKDSLDSEGLEDDDYPTSAQHDVIVHDDSSKIMRRQRTQPRQPDYFESTDIYESQELSVDYNVPKNRARSGPLYHQFHRTETRRDSQNHQAVRRSRFYRDV